MREDSTEITADSRLHLLYSTLLYSTLLYFTLLYFTLLPVRQPGYFDS